MNSNSEQSVVVAILMVYQKCYVRKMHYTYTTQFAFMERTRSCVQLLVFTVYAWNEWVLIKSLEESIYFIFDGVNVETNEVCACVFYVQSVKKYFSVYLFIWKS